MSEYHTNPDQFDWEAWTTEYPHRARGAEVLQRFSQGLPLSPREAGIADYVHKQSESYRDLDMDQETLARIQIDIMGTFLNGTVNSGKLAEIAKLSDERPPEQEAIK
jgi:hypothetical protein